jgi:hypothetical protein
MSARLLTGNLLCDHGLPLPKRMAMDGAPPPAPREVTLDTGEAQRELQERNELRRLIPNLYRL